MYYYLYHLKGGCILYFVYMLIYYVLNYNTNFSYSSQNGIEYLIGACLVSLLSQLTELLIYRVAYKFTGLLYYTATISGEHEGKTVKKIPVLGDLPVVGTIFRSTSSDKKKNELVIMITPKIVTDTEDAVGADTL